MTLAARPLVLLLTTFGALASPTLAQEDPPDVPTFMFDGELYAWGSTTNKPDALINGYFPREENPNGLEKRIQRTANPRMGNCLEHVQRVGQNVKSQNPDAVFSIMGDSDADAALCAALTILDGGRSHMIEIMHFTRPVPNLAATIGTHFAVRLVGSEAQAKLRQLLDEKLKSWTAEIVRLQAPTPFLPFKGEAVGDHAALGGLVSVEGLSAGRVVNVDAKFAQQLGAEDPPQPSFRVLVPLGVSNLKINGRPNVPEIALFATTTDESNVIEVVRYTGLTHGNNPNVGNLLLSLSWIVEHRVASSTLAKYQGRVVDRYRTKIGDYPAAVILAESDDPAGPDYYFKFVILPKPNSTDGLAAVIMIDKELSPDVKSLADTMSKGFAAKVLHSTRFLEDER